MKKLQHKSIIGQKGANYIEKVFLDMGQVWRPTTIFDTGVDGLVEFRDVTTGQMSNRQLQVQSKATENLWESESDTSFVFRVSQDDLTYWLRGNLAVIFVASRPDSNEAYWVSIKDYFSDTRHQAERKIVFDKARQKFDQNCLAQLLELSVKREAGISYPALRQSETLVSNLVSLKSYPAILHTADSSISDPKLLIDWLVSKKIPHCREFFIREKRIFSFHDLSVPPWSEICDRGTYEPFQSWEWANSDDIDRQRDWVEILNRSLQQMLRRDGVFFNSEKKFRFYYFRPNASKHGEELKVHLKPDAEGVVRRLSFDPKKKGRGVVIEIKDKRSKAFLCFRHFAAELRFRRFAKEWFVEVSPTYYYSTNGVAPSPLHEFQLSGIKRLEKNNAVIGQIRFWSSLLQERRDLLREPYPWLVFGDLLELESPEGIPDDSWRPISDVESTEDDGGQLF